MKAITSTSERLEEGVNYEVVKQTTWNGIEWLSYNAKVGNSSFSCISLEQLQSKISNYIFETKEDKLITERAIAEFGTCA